MEELKGAIHDLKLSIVKDEVRRLTTQFIIQQEENIFLWILRQLASTTEDPWLNINELGFQHFSGHQYIEENIRKSMLMMIIDYMCSELTPLITDRVEEVLHYYQADDLISTFDKYKRGITCSVCGHNSHQSHEYSNHCLITHPCSCEGYIHLTCLLNNTRAFGSQCKICHKSYYAPTYHKRYYYPNIDVYPRKNGNYTIAVDTHQRLELAISYGQVDRVADILTSITRMDLHRYLCRLSYSSIHSVEDGLLRVNGKLPYRRYKGPYTGKYVKIESLLNNKIHQLQINCKDLF